MKKCTVKAVIAFGIIAFVGGAILSANAKSKLNDESEAKEEIEE